jgi:uncharacterized protein (TIGR03067 family)
LRTGYPFQNSFPEDAMKRMLLVLVVGLLVAADDATKEEAIKKDMKLLEGKWTLTSSVIEGEKKEGDDAKGEVIFTEGKFEAKSPDGTSHKGSFTIDPTKSPKAIDSVPSEGDDAGKTRYGIYELKDDSLKICIANEGGERPTNFEAANDKILLVYKRAK